MCDKDEIREILSACKLFCLRFVPRRLGRPDLGLDRRRAMQLRAYISRVREQLQQQLRHPHLHLVSHALFTVSEICWNKYFNTFNAWFIPIRSRVCAREFSSRIGSVCPSCTESPYFQLQVSGQKLSLDGISKRYIRI